MHISSSIDSMEFFE